MKVVSVMQPWAAAAVLGRLEVINMPFTTGHKGTIAIHAGNLDPGASCNEYARQFSHIPHARERRAVLGFVDLMGCGRPDCCDIMGACGPWCWIISNALVLPEPIIMPKFRNIRDMPELDEHLATAVKPSQFALDLSMKGLTEEQVYGPKRSDSYRGD